MSNSLAGVNILVSRPEKHAHNLVTAINLLHGNVICVPLFKIDSILDSALLDQINSEIANCDLAICTSRNVAELLLPEIYHYQKVTWAAVGPATAEFLLDYGIDKVLYPKHAPFDSEGLISLLKSEGYALANMKVVIFTGDGGREYLSQELCALGAKVNNIIIYKRSLPEITSNDLLELLFIKHRTNIIIITCVTSLINLCGLSADSWPKVLQIPLLVVSKRIFDYAINMGFVSVYNAGEMSDVGILNTLARINIKAGI